jgi:hypothetical protein
MRTLTAPVTSAIKSDTGYGRFIAVELDYPAGMVRVNSTQINLEIEGQNYLGLGILGSISDLREAADGQSVAYSLQLTGVPEYLTVGGVKKRATDYFGEQNVQGRSARVFLGFTNAKNQVVGVKVINVGFMDAQDISLGVVRVSCETIAIDWYRPRVRYLTDNDQQKQYPGDTFFEFIAALPGMQLKWGRA